ncbi:hypothetical protein QJV15_10120 [Listeria cossartiae subsp. cayugensis]|uniref:hypothetical protein n=1 Tax=Listeria cossartiae TaxID=2838249 RepID=UPI0028806766|nr:hypothetical protein [Listeria cossartiae]MDT0001225.1 hypothetical protein [Listeria cossartiae subsp. cayugensis]MDT0009553.1 hypothetical protein [Listeria cossartiae subsp. cayugensis]MDT0031255.1 hypothetical protein [Listeria cossartiae subsp. cayugensis]MDT0039371.1 hypothetical protein [Listeria cossartiae subsp. cayugensis]MDT0044850.1 hypothetical protein [Listeria cossartiae subsp. cayugensis]
MDKELYIKLWNFAFLKTLKKDGNIDFLLVDEDYSQYINQVSLLEKASIIIREGDMYKITKTGHQYMQELKTELTIEQQDINIFPLFNYLYNGKLSLNEVYLP